MNERHPHRIVVTETGVHQPPRLALEAVVFTIALIAVLAAFARASVSSLTLALDLALLALFALARWRAHRRHGRLGRPCVAVSGGALLLALPQDSRGSVTLDLAEFRRLIVYGREGRRTLRAVRADGTHREWTPLWSPMLEQVIVAFLQRRLPAACALSVEAPQTLLASIRQEGPSTAVDPSLHRQ